MSDTVINLVPRLALSFKPKNVRTFEKENGPITDNLDATVDKLTKLVQAGNGNCSEETADSILESFLDNGGDIIEGIVQVIEALQRGGFLPRDLAIASIMRKQMKSQMAKLGQELEETLGNDSKVETVESVQ